MARVEPRPGGAGPRPGLDAALRRFARFVFGLVFREVELVGAERMPANGPAIVIANHSNSIIDGGVLLAHLPRVPRFLAASTVWDYKPVAPFMNASGSVKVFRQQDGRAHEGSLEDSFAEAAALLADGGVLAVFPEGRTHDDPALLPFKTGAARIAVFTQARHGPLDLPVVPLGIDYEVKNLFRTRVCLSFGAPVWPGSTGAPGPPRDTGRDTDGVRAATAELRHALGAVAPDFADREEAETLTLAAEIRALHPADAPGRAPKFSRILAARDEMQAALASAGTEAAEATGAAQGARETRAALADYRRALAQTGLSDHEVAARAGRGALLRSALALAAGLPVALIAVLFNLPQALVLRTVSRTKERDRQMTWMTFGGIVLFPLTWTLWAGILGLVAGTSLGAGWGWAVAGATLVAAPLSARLALPTIDRAGRIARGLRARRLFRRDAGLGARLTDSRARARAALEALVGGAPPRGPV